VDRSVVPGTLEGVASDIPSAPEPPLPVVADDPQRMQKMLGILYARASEMIGKTASRGLIPLDTITVLVLPVRDVHARTSTFEGATTINISLGLIHLLYGINRALAARAVVTDGAAAPEHPSVNLEDELCACLDRAAAPLLPLKGGSRLTEDQVRLAELHTRWAEWFVLAHELAHAHEIDQAAVGQVPALARFDAQHERTAREHAADLFAVWLLRAAAVAQMKTAGPQLASDDSVLQMLNIAYAGAELALQAVNLLELYDPSLRPALHPTALDRMRFLRERMVDAGDEALLRDSVQWTRLLGANAPRAVALAAMNAAVAGRELAALIQQGSASSDGAWLDDRERVMTFLLGSRSGTMRLLLRLITQPGDDRVLGRAATALAERYLPRVEPAYAPFWKEIDRGQGGWTCPIRARTTVAT